MTKVGRWGWVWVRRRYTNALAYSWPDEVPLVVGGRVLVPLGRADRPTIGLVVAAGEGEPPFPALKPILSHLDERPIYDKAALLFFEWLAFYYMAPPGDVAQVVLPGRAGSVADWEVSWLIEPSAPLRPKKTFAHLRALQTFRVRSVARALNQKPQRLYQILRSWAQAGYVRLRPIFWRPKAPVRSFVVLSAAYREAKAFEALWEAQPPQIQPLLLEILRASLGGLPVPYSRCLRAGGQAAQALLREGILERVPTRLYYEALYARPQVPYELTPAQRAAFEAIQSALKERPLRPVLLHGVTASGKTFIYMELVRAYLQKGYQVLYLLPEIALTKQTVDRLRGTFGEGMALYHSSLSAAERFRVWQDVASKRVDVVVGTRSALFLPFRRLGLFIVDEEHDPSYGQEGRSPRYQARDSAIYYAHLRQVPIVLGSATPAIETYYRAQQGKYHLVSLPEKAFPTRPPKLFVVDMRTEFRHQLSQGVFSSVLLEALRDAIGAGRQAILFRNRRGFAPVLFCKTCGYHYECAQCDISLTYHKAQHVLLCHYCGHAESVPARCRVCGSPALSFSGVGTERIEEQLRQFLPGVRVLRLDRDTAGGQKHQALIARFERGEADVLVGTQMVTKGLDFERVTLVGVLYTDSLLARPDYRAEERAYQLLIQLIGRAGRRGQEALVVIQTFQPQHPLFAQLEAPYEAVYERLLAERRTHQYSPFCRLLQIDLRHKDQTLLEQQSLAYAQQLRRLKVPVLGPVYGSIPRVEGYYRMSLRLKLPPQYALRPLRQFLLALTKAHEKQWGSVSAQVSFQVDP